MGIYILFYAFIFAIGVCIGSFLNVCILRIPEKKSIVTPSVCVSCGKRLKWYELIPLLSYICLRGKCYGCKSEISLQYPLIEGINGLLWLLTCLMLDLFGKLEAVATVAIAAGDYPDLFAVSVTNAVSLLATPVLFSLAASALLTIAVIDIRTMEIPPSLNVAILVLGILRLALDLPVWYAYLIGAVSVSGVLLILWLITGGRALGGGDIKLMAVCGLLLGWKLIIIAFLLGCIIGSVVHLTRMLISKAGRVLAFGPYLAAGVYAAMLWGHKILDWYLQLYAWQ